MPKNYLSPLSFIPLWLFLVFFLFSIFFFLSSPLEKSMSFFLSRQDPFSLPPPPLVSHHSRQPLTPMFIFNLLSDIFDNANCFLSSIWIIFFFFLRLLFISPFISRLDICPVHFHFLVFSGLLSTFTPFHRFTIMLTLLFTNSSSYLLSFLFILFFSFSIFFYFSLSLSLSLSLFLSLSHSGFLFILSRLHFDSQTPLYFLYILSRFLFLFFITVLLGEWL